MTVAVCEVCGARITLRSQFEVDGDCPECGAEEALVAEDAYDPEPLELICADCRARVEGGPSRRNQQGGEHEGRFTVDDPCPFCSTDTEPGELVPFDTFVTPRDLPETPVARAAARNLWIAHGRPVPVDVVAIARKAGLDVRFGPHQHAGRLIDGTTIEVPTSDPLARQRFTVAHELGHATLRHQVPTEKLEVEANAFAAELLLPREELVRAVRETPSFNEISTRFQASRQATLYALMAARLIGKLHTKS